MGFRLLILMVLVGSPLMAGAESPWDDVNEKSLPFLRLRPRSNFANELFGSLKTRQLNACSQGQLYYLRATKQTQDSRRAEPGVPQYSLDQLKREALEMIQGPCDEKSPYAIDAVEMAASWQPDVSNFSLTYEMSDFRLWDSDETQSAGDYYTLTHFLKRLDIDPSRVYIQRHPEPSYQKTSRRYWHLLLSEDAPHIAQYTLTFDGDTSCRLSLKGNDVYTSFGRTYSLEENTTNLPENVKCSGFLGRSDFDFVLGPEDLQQTLDFLERR